MKNNIQTLFKEWESLQPLKSEDQKRLDDKFNLEFNYNSNHIEGNTLTYGQTKLLLVFGEATGDAKMRDLEEMKAHNVGLKWIRERAKDKEYVLTERDIRDLNRIILAEDYYKLNTQTGTRYEINVGVYKTRLNSVITATGETFDYASPEETPALMYELIKWFNEEVEKAELTPIELASLLHYRYIRIHPFEDGNGRIARLLVTYVLERFGYPMVIIKSENKEEYLSVLHRCDINVGLTPSEGTNASLKDIEPFVEYMERQLEWSLNICIKAAKGDDIESDDDWKKKLTLKLGNKKGAPEVTDEFAQNAIATYKELLLGVDIQLLSYYPLFDAVQWLRGEGDMFSRNEVRDKVELNDAMSIKISGGKSTYSLFFLKNRLEIYIKFELFLKQYNYEIIIWGCQYGASVIADKYELRYDERLYSENIKDTVNKCGKFIQNFENFL